jgi:LPS-assembly protein
MKRALALVALALAVAGASAQEAPPRPPTPESAVAPPPPPAQPVEAAQPAPPRLTFEVRFPASQGGGAAQGSAGEVSYETDDRVVASGGVELKYQDLVVRADSMTLDRNSRQLLATGAVRLTQGPRRLEAESATFDLGAKTGSFRNASADVEAEYYFRGSEIAKTGDNSYRVRDGVFTSCGGESPPWSFQVARADIEVQGYAHVRHARMRIRRLPVLYLPYLVWPARQARSSGLLIPNVGYSKRRGSYLGLAYYQTLGRSYDATLFLDGYSENYLGVGGEFRYRPSEGTEGLVQAYLLDDPESIDKRWKLHWDHEMRNLPGGLRGVVSYRDFSDFDFFRDFDRARDRVTLRTLESTGFLTGSWGPHSLNVLAQSQETFLGEGQSVVQERLPQVEYRLRPMRLGRSPLYLQGLGTAANLSVERTFGFAGRYARLDAGPELSLPLRPAPWFSLKLTAGGRLTWYGDTLCRPATGPLDRGPEVCGASGQVFVGESLRRVYETAGAQLVGPSFSRIYEGRGAFGKFKHIVEPRFVYTRLGEFEDAARYPLFDEVDTPRPTELGRLSVVSRVLAKPKTGPPGAATAREILSLELARRTSFDATRPLQTSRIDGATTTGGPLTLELRFAPSARTHLRVETEYSDFRGGFESRSFSGALALGRHSLSGTWYTQFDPEAGRRPRAPGSTAFESTLSDQVGVQASLALLPKRLRLDSQFNYDLKNGDLRQGRVFLNWIGSCYDFRFELRELRAEGRADRDYRFAVNLKNVGTFGDLNGGDRLGGAR